MVSSNNLRFSYSRSIAYNVATSISKLSFFLYFLNIIGSIGFLIWIAVTNHNYFLLALIPAILIINIFIHRLGFIVYISYIGLVLSYMLGWNIWFFSICGMIAILHLGYEIWWGYTSYVVQNALLNDEELFFKMWVNRALAMRDTKGNFYLYFPEQ